MSDICGLRLVYLESEYIFRGMECLLIVIVIFIWSKGMFFELSMDIVRMME